MSTDRNKLDPLIEAARDLVMDACVKQGQGGVVGGLITTEAISHLAPVLEAALKMRGNFQLRDTATSPWQYNQMPPGAEVVADFKAFDAAVTKLTRDAY